MSVIGTRFCVRESHGGNPSTCYGGDEEVLEHYRWIHAHKSWHHANDHCRHLGGSLITSLNGTKEQIKFFVDKVLPSAPKYDWDNVAWLGDVNTHLTVRILPPELKFLVQTYCFAAAFSSLIGGEPCYDKLSIFNGMGEPYLLLTKSHESYGARSICDMMV